jgi:hypothetical protein
MWVPDFFLPGPLRLLSDVRARLPYKDPFRPAQLGRSQTTSTQYATSSSCSSGVDGRCDGGEFARASAEAAEEAAAERKDLEAAVEWVPQSFANRACRRSEPRAQAGKFDVQMSVQDSSTELTPLAT